MAVARDGLGRAARKRGIEGQVTTIRHFGIRCITDNGERKWQCITNSISKAFPTECRNIFLLCSIDLPSVYCRYQFFLKLDDLL